MKAYAPHYDLTKESSIQGVANPNSEIYKSASNLESTGMRVGKIEQALLKQASEYQELTTAFKLPLDKTAGSFRVVYDPKAKPIIRSTIKNIWNFAKKHPKTTIAVGAFGYGASQGKKIGKRQQGEVLQQSITFKERKPKILAYKRGKK